MDIVSAFSPKVRVRLDASKGSMTKQSFKAECDINVIMKRFSTTGVLPESVKSPIFGDVRGLEFREMVDIIAQAQAGFDSLPSAVRKRFGNDPADFLSFVSDEANAEELVRMGLRKAPEAVVVAPVVPEVKEAAKAAPVAS